jgi:thiol-disulfide isomerase/thioredoxin
MSAGERWAVKARHEGDAQPDHGAHRLSRRQLLATAAVWATGAGLVGCQKEAKPDAQLEAFWALRLPAAYPSGSDGSQSHRPAELALAAFRGHPLLVNFWATWCPPCLEEMPLISRYCAEHPTGRAQGWQCLGLAVEDRPEPVARFLAHTPVSFPIALAGLAGVQLSRSLGNVDGALPFSLLLDDKGRVKYRKIGQLRSSDLNTWLG